MSAKTTNRAAEDITTMQRLEHGATGVTSGALAGGVVGAVAGPAAAVAGAVIGGIAGVLAATAMDNDATREARKERELDEELGVMGGDLGTAAVDHPPASLGAFSATSMGAEESSDIDEADGPIEPPPEG